MTLKELINISDTGDILLFRGNSFTCKVQRMITGSRFGIFEIDHVAALLRYENDKLVMLEATGNEVNLMKGVALYFWDSFIRFKNYEAYDYVVFRHLDFTRSLETVSKMENFIKVKH